MVDYMSENPAAVKFFYASNVQDDLQSLKNLLIYAVKSKASFVLLTNVITPQISGVELSSYRHAIQFMEEGFSKQTDFKDLNQFMKTYRQDVSGHILAKSANKILSIVEKGAIQLKDQARKTLRLLQACEIPVRIIPGQNENVDLICKLVPELKPFYVNVQIEKLSGLNILGIGGLQKADPEIPLQFQDNEYFEGGLDAREQITELLNEPIDIFVSFAPIKYKTDEGEKDFVRPLVNEYLPGRLILTSQCLLPQFDVNDKTATDALLVRGGNFSSVGIGPHHIFWDIDRGENREFHLQAKQLRGDFVVPIQSAFQNDGVPLVAKDEPQIIFPVKRLSSADLNNESIGEPVGGDVKTQLLDISISDNK